MTDVLDVSHIVYIGNIASDNNIIKTLFVEDISLVLNIAGYYIKSTGEFF